jgi:soluble lytic murein transglycosylase-like protein
MEIELQLVQSVVQAAPIAQASVNRGMGNRSSDVEEWRPLVAGHFEPEDVDRILCLMEHESGGNPNAANPRSSASGLMQVMASVWADEFDVTWDQLYEPEINLYVARQILDRQGFTAWAPYNRGLCR